jgi:hypothetical protein
MPTMHDTDRPLRPHRALRAVALVDVALAMAD